MALKDLKSELSNFRLPKKEPLDSKPRVKIEQTQNQTPLSGMVESAPKIPRSTTTTNKEGVNPQKMDNSSKFLGETNPQKMDNSEKFLGETNPQPMSLEERYLGQTTPNKFDNSEKFLGETTPKPSDKESKFLGETDPTKFDNTSNFVRFRNEKISSPFATEPNQMNLDAKFLGETTPNPSDKESKFLGETTQTPSNRESKFLGETTPNPMIIPNGEKLLGETTPTPKDSTGQFLGETDKTPISQGDKNKGETTPSDFTFTGKLENEGKDFKEVNYFSDIHASGFTSKFGGVEATKFVGVNPNNTVFDTATSKYGDFGMSVDGLNSAPGYGKFKLNKAQTGNTQRYNPDKNYYINTKLSNKGISELQETRNSPSFLDEMYHKFNLRDDAFNLGTAAFAHPLILRGIQRKSISKGEPQKWGFGFPIDDGLVRGGIVTAVDRAVVDAVRLGKWMVSVKGLLWGIKNLGLQASNANVETITGKRLTKVWTPINTIASTLGGFIGLHPRRHGILPLPEAVGPEKYEFVQKAKRLTHDTSDNDGNDNVDSSLTLLGTGNRLARLWKTTFGTDRENGLFTLSKAGIGRPFLDLAGRGGGNSLYGLIPNGQFPKQDFQSAPFKDYSKTTGPRPKPKKIGGSYKAPYTNTNIRIQSAENVDDNEFSIRGTIEGKNPNTTEENALKFPYLDPNFKQKKEFNGGGSNSIDANGNTNGDVPGAEVIKDYETIAYGSIPERVTGTTSNTNDFRSLLSDTNPSKKIADSDNYSEYNINKRVNFGNPGKLGPSENRYEWWNTTSNAGNTDRFDPIQASPIGQPKTIPNDLVHLWFRPTGQREHFIQFRGAVSGITDTFSPSWDSFKYNGRADQAYKYSSFERSLSFNIQVYATSRVDMLPIWEKLGRLASMTMPTYSDSGAGYNGKLVEFRLGSLYDNELALIDSLSYTMSDETPWEISMLGSKEYIGELPMGIDVSIGLKILGKEEPRFGATHVFGKHN